MDDLTLALAALGGDRRARRGRLQQLADPQGRPEARPPARADQREPDARRAPATCRWSRASRPIRWCAYEHDTAAPPDRARRRPDRCDVDRAGDAGAAGCAPPRRAPARLDALIDVLAHAARSSRRSPARRVLAHAAADAPRRQQAVRDRRPERRQRRLGNAGRRASATARSRPACSWPTAPARSTRSSTPSSCMKVQAFADAHRRARPSFPDMLDEVARARELDAVCQRSTTRSCGSRCARAAPPGAPATCSSTPRGRASSPGRCPGRMVLPAQRRRRAAGPGADLRHAGRAGRRPDPVGGARADAELRRAADRRSDRALRAWHARARALAAAMDAVIVDDHGQPLGPPAFASIGAELEHLYDTLDARDLAAGSAAARRVFS